MRHTKWWRALCIFMTFFSAGLLYMSDTVPQMMLNSLLVLTYIYMAWMYAEKYKIEKVEEPKDRARALALKKAGLPDNQNPWREYL